MERYAIGVDLGGSKIEAALIDRSGGLLSLCRRLTNPDEGADRVISRIVDCIDELMEEAGGDDGIEGVGIGSPGVVYSRDGVVAVAANLGWNEVPLRRLVAGSLGREWEDRVWIENDTNAAALGEMLYGAGRAVRDLLYLTIGTGVGSGMVLNGHIYRGASGSAGEIGHMVIDPEGEPCRCGRRGCLETLVAGPAIARQARASVRRGMPSSLSRTNPDEITAVEVVSAALTGDWLARTALESAGVYLGMALAYYVSINNPSLIIVGGGVGEAAGELLLAAARQVIEARAMPNNAQSVKVVQSGLGGAAGAMGAAALVWQQRAD